MNNSNWDKTQEAEFKDLIKKFFEEKISKELNGARDILKVGDILSDILKDSDQDVVKMIIPV